ncbi:MAG: hypothetical protein EA392_12300 [Cryomorphaceae bacterium]|nr:MAG: hypothetical protein EA392_12300 [Cryomorphaceae bacterium]
MKLKTETVWKSLKLHLAAYFWLMGSQSIRFAFTSKNCILLKVNHTGIAPYLPGLLAGFDRDSLCTGIGDRKTLLSLYLLKDRKLPRTTICLFPSEQSRRWVIDNHHAPGADHLTRFDYFHAVRKAHQNKLPAHEAILPFVMHPSQYGKLRDTTDSEKRRIKVFFSGNTHPKSYNQPQLRSLFGVMTRSEIHRAVLDDLAPFLNTRLNGDVSRPVWWLSWQWQQGEPAPDNRIGNDEWMDFLFNSDFFVACPGVNMPLSHNLIEAMYAGCIPILPYASWLYPALKDGENCLTFSGRESLIQCIQKALSMPDGELKAMRQAVQQYYSDHLHPDGVRKIIMDPAVKTSYFAMNMVSTSLFAKEQNNRAN